MNTEYMTVRQAAQLLGVTTRTVQQWIKDGRFSGAYQILEGRTMPWLIPVAEVQAVHQQRQDKKK